MTSAVCMFCGEMKFGAFNACASCGKEPFGNEDLMLSLAMTDHYFKIDTLRDFGKSIKEGTRPELSEAMRAQLLPVLKELGTILPTKVSGELARQEKKNIKWWPF